ncbi:CARDB domain-containing protein [Nostoc sp.]|uniref:CARDB domain-containing protein n=1 Tax=Nostoc sp. TaxID=1180 RepID=UPI002FFA24DF
MFETSENHIDSSLPNLGNSLQSLNNNSVNLSPADLTGLNSRRLLTLAGETLINAWQNQTNPTQALVYTAASIFNPNFVTNAQIAFGKTFDISKAEELGADILGGIYGVLPNVKFLSNTEMNGALGAYAKSTDTIYLNSAFLTQNAANPTAIGKVLVEETGHFLDVYASPIDSPGDEGDILARLTNNEEISNEALKALKSEDDRGIVLLSQGSLEVEQAFVSGNSLNNSLYGTSYTDSIYGYAGNDYLSGGDGDDSLYGGDGDDVLDGGFGFDFLDGGNGKDTVSYDFYNGGITLNLRTGIVSFPGNSTLTETVINIEAVIGSRGNDVLTGDSFNNSLNGNSGNDVLDAYGSGLLERDDLLGGLGSDRFILGDVNNTYYTRSGSSDLAAIADFRVGEDTIQLKQLSNSVTSSSQAYGYRLITVGNSTEIRLDNNELIAILSSVTGLSLTSSAFQFVGTADLIIQNQNAPTSTTVGSTVSISAYTKNNGLGTAAASTVSYWLSNDTSLDKSDIAIGSQSVGSLSAGISGYNPYSFIYNSTWGTGNKYILFQADANGNVAESNELNNLAFAAINITQPLPDLIIQNQNAPTSTTVGSTVSISAYTKNNGLGTAAASTVSYWLSNDTSLDKSDIAIGSQSVGSLSAGISGYNPYSFIYNSTWGTGNKYILFQADANGNVAESNELNNLAFAAINISDWYSQNLRDSGISSLTRSLAADGNLSRNDMINIFRDAKDGNIIDAYEFSDLSTIVSNNSRFNMADDVRILSNKIANSDTANTNSGIGNLYVGSSSTQMDNLIGKWFLGNDRPDAYSYNGSTQYTYHLIT